MEKADRERIEDYLADMVDTGQMTGDEAQEEYNNEIHGNCPPCEGTGLDGCGCMCEWCRGTGGK